MGVALEWEPWSWDLWNTPLEPDDDESGLGLFREKLDEAPEAGWESEKTLVQRAMGHSSVRVTEGYEHLVGEDLLPLVEMSSQEELKALAR